MRKSMGHSPCCDAAGTLPTYAQNPKYNVGPVWRVVYYHIKPGQGEAFWKDFRENGKPVYESLKKEGLISDYKVWTNVTTDSSGDWNVALGLQYPNWAALDQADAKVDNQSWTKHYCIARCHAGSGKETQ